MPDRDFQTRSKMRVTVAGASGYAGGELLRLLLGHPRVESVAAVSSRNAGKPIDSVHPHLRGRTRSDFLSRDEVNGADVVFLALPHGESSADADALLELAPVVIDLSADFRL